MEDDSYFLETEADKAVLGAETLKLPLPLRSQYSEEGERSTREVKLVRKDELEGFQFSYKKGRLSITQYFTCDGRKVEEHEHPQKGCEYHKFERKTPYSVEKSPNLYPLKSMKVLSGKDFRPYVFVEEVEGELCFDYLCYDGEKPVLNPVQIKLGPIKRNNILVYLGLEPEEIAEEEAAETIMIKPSSNEGMRADAQSVKKFLDTMIVGQEAAKQAIAPVFAQYWDRPSGAHKNLLLVGPSGSGKVSLIESLAKESNMPLLKLTPEQERIEDIAELHYRTYQSHTSSGAILLAENIEKWNDAEVSWLDELQRGRTLAKMRDGFTATLKSDQLLYVATGAFNRIKHSSQADVLSPSEMVKERKANYEDMNALDLAHRINPGFLSRVVIAPFKNLTAEEVLRTMTETPLSYAAQQAERLGHEIAFPRTSLEKIAENSSAIAQNLLEAALRPLVNNPEAFLEDGKYVLKSEKSEE